MVTADKVRENKVRRAAKRQGFVLKKSRARYTYPLSIYDYGGYMLVGDDLNSIVAGEKFQLSLEEAETFLNLGKKIWWLINLVGR